MVIFQFAMLVITRGDISWLPWDHDFQSDQPMNRAPHPSARRIRRLSSDLASEASWALEVSPNKWGKSILGNMKKYEKMARYGKIIPSFSPLVIWIAPRKHGLFSAIYTHAGP